MLTAVTAAGPTLQAAIAPSFGRCAFLVFVESDTGEVQAVANPGVQAVGGAGIQAAQTVAARHARALVTGRVGPNAMRVLQAAGIEIFTTGRGTVGEALAAHGAGQLARLAEPTARGRGA